MVGIATQTHTLSDRAADHSSHTLYYNVSSMNEHNKLAIDKFMKWLTEYKCIAMNRKCYFVQHIDSIEQ